MKGLFQNPKATLVYVAITLFGVMLAVGTEDNPGGITGAVELVGGETGNYGPDKNSEREYEDDDGPGDEDRTRGEDGDVLGPDRQLEKSPKRPSSPTKTFGPATFSSDADLIDDAEGFDPSPNDDGEDTEDSESDFGGWADGGY